MHRIPVSVLTFIFHFHPRLKATTYGMIGFLAAALSLLLGCDAIKTFHIANQLTGGPVPVEFTVGPDTFLDGPKLATAANSSIFEWWYFDAISTTTNATVVVVLYNTGPNGFINQWFHTPTSLSITGLFPNGTAYSRAVSARGAVVNVDQNGIDGTWTASGVSFKGTKLSQDTFSYTLTVDSPDYLGIVGHVTWDATAPPHYGCSPDTNIGTSETLAPHIGWSNAVPDAIVKVDLTFNGTEHLAFDDGIGYHDKNWGDRPFFESVTTWYWGRARLGPFTVIFFDTFDGQGQEHTAAYVSRLDGIASPESGFNKNFEVLQTSCADGTISVRPWGQNSEFPPTPMTQIVEGVDITLKLADGSDFVARYTEETTAVYVNGYQRTIGWLEGGIAGAEKFKGRMILEQFAFG